jgi:hypothetical protein
MTSRHRVTVALARPHRAVAAAVQLEGMEMVLLPAKRNLDDAV